MMRSIRDDIVDETIQHTYLYQVNLKMLRRTLIDKHGKDKIIKRLIHDRVEKQKACAQRCTLISGWSVQQSLPLLHPRANSYLIGPSRSMLLNDIQVRLSNGVRVKHTVRIVRWFHSAWIADTSINLCIRQKIKTRKL